MRDGVASNRDGEAGAVDGLFVRSIREVMRGATRRRSLNEPHTFLSIMYHTYKVESSYTSLRGIFIWQDLTRGLTFVASVARYVCAR
jgi:hypothetical protein